MEEHISNLLPSWEYEYWTEYFNGYAKLTQQEVEDFYLSIT